MEYLGNIIDSIIANFDFAFMISVNVLTYYIVKLLDKFNGDKAVPSWVKVISLIVSTIILGIIFLTLGSYDNKMIILNSAILAPISWNVILKPILKYFDIGYKEFDDNLR